MTAGPLRRVRPLLGTFVEIRVEGLGAARGGRAIDCAFAEIAAVHRLMSFQEAGSDLDRLHRARVGERIAIDARTHDVLAWSVRIAAASAGAFDPTVAARQVERGLLPRPASTWTAHRGADWRDVELADSLHVRLARPLWIDLGGIAKGYAVDRAVAILRDAGAQQVCVNAGGDLRVAGPRAEIVHLRTANGIAAAPAVQISDGALATSGGALAARTSRAARLAVLKNGGNDELTDAARTVSVAAPLCVVADALTKVVLVADAAVARRTLREFAAHALVASRDGGAGVTFGAAA